MIFETHAHYDDEKFDTDRDEVLSGLCAQNIGTVINVGANMRGSAKSLTLAHKWDFVYAAVGTHPDDADKMTDKDYERLRDMACDSRCVAIGEIGLDYAGECVDVSIQKECFKRQLKLAFDMNKPVIIHSRDAAQDTFDILTEYHKLLKDNIDTHKDLYECPGVIHCFSYEKELAREYIKMGFYIGVGGVCTFKNGRKLKEVVTDIPLTSILLETDSPYLSPEPFRGKRNDSGKLKYVVAQIAALKNIDIEIVENVTFENAKRMYRLK